MKEPHLRLKIGLLALCLLHLAFFCAVKYSETVGISGILYPNGTPVGGDFVNLWSAARLVVAGDAERIYSVDAFMAYQHIFTDGADIGLRLWAYPPLSLLLIWPFGLVGYYAGLTCWSVLGLAVLWFGARRFGFDRLETAIILISPATILNLYYGQTGSIATGLLLIAFSARSLRDPLPVAGATLLTIKPQAGFLIPVLWTFQRRWQAIAWTIAAVLAFLVLSVALFGIQPWRDYLGETLPVLSALERRGSGPFMNMIPSTFMSFRILTDDWRLALIAHATLAVCVAAVVLVRLWRVEDHERRVAVVLVATALLTPYMHNYDLALLLCGTLLIARRVPNMKYVGGGELLVIVALALPQLVVLLNATGIPVSPLLILPLLFLA